MHLSTSYAVVGLPALALGCGDASSPNIETLSPLRAFAVSSGPAMPGNSGIVRFGAFVGFFVYDMQRGLLSIHSTSTPFADICGGTPPVIDSLDIQTIATVSGLHAIFQGQNHNVLIYPAVPFDCSFLATAPLLAAGTVHLIRTDNDLRGEGSPGTDAFGWQAEGDLRDLATGEVLRYTEIARFLFTPAEKELSVDIRLH
jgi:hypothetical protein